MIKKIKTIVVIGISLGGVIFAAYVTGYTVCEHQLRKDLIEIGYGQYNAKTGRFEFTPQDQMQTNLLFAEDVQVKNQTHPTLIKSKK